MFDQPLTEAPPTLSEPSEPLIASDIDAARGMMGIVLVGVAVVLVAMLLMRWPVIATPEVPPDFGPQFQRVLGGLSGENPRGIVGVIVDLSIYAILSVAVLMAVRTLRTGKHDWLGGVIVAGLLGMAYVAGMVLYIGPMVSACGFSLIVFGGLVAWLAANAPADEGQPQSSGGVSDAGPTTAQFVEEPNPLEAGAV
jgi:hypothetical protein